MKTRLFVVLFGLFSLFGSTAALAHNPGYGGAYVGVPLTGGITIWGDSYGRTGYAGNVSLGLVGGYANIGYASVPYYGQVNRPVYGYRSSHGYDRGSRQGYRHGYRHGRHRGHHNRHHYNDHRDRRH